MSLGILVVRRRVLEISRKPNVSNHNHILREMYDFIEVVGILEYTPLQADAFNKNNIHGDSGFSN